MAKLWDPGAFMWYIYPCSLWLLDWQIEVAPEDMGEIWPVLKHKQVQIIYTFQGMDCYVKQGEKITWHNFLRDVII